MPSLLIRLRQALGISELRAELRRANQQMQKLNQRLDALEEQARADKRWRGHFLNRSDALLRARYLDALGADHYPFALTARRFKLYSQNEEDGMVLALLQAAGAPTRRFLEIGSGGSGGNSGMLARELGWQGLMVDLKRANIKRAREKFGGNPKVSFEALAVTPANVDDLIERHGLAGEIDFFSLDIDSFDYWVLAAMTASSPRVMVLEYNANFGPEAAVTIDADSDASELRKGLHGASLAALTKLAADKGYRLVACDETGTNAFYLRNDLRPDIPALAPSVAYRAAPNRENPFGSTGLEASEFKRLAAEQSVRLVEV